MAHITVETPIGSIVLHGDKNAVTAIDLPGNPIPEGPEEETVVLAQARQQLLEYFAGKRTDFTIPLRSTGTAFQEAVWTAMQQIPFGKTVSYGDLALAAGSPGAARAVGQANRSNPFPIVVPCHRIISADGSIGGYMGVKQGDEGMKAWLLRHEGALD
ncbi:MAG: methylated-DNA--[protein]-cysteine S-methyltransferase [Thermoplasmatota archaeon]